MTIILVYISPNGTTGITAKNIAIAAERNNHNVEIINIGRAEYRDYSNKILEKISIADIVGFGSPAFHMDVLQPMQDFLKLIINNNKKYLFNFKSFIFVNYAGITTGKAIINTSRMLKKINIPVIGALKIKAPHLHHKEEFPTSETIQIIDKFYNNLVNNGFKDISWKTIKRSSPEKIIVNFLFPIAKIIAKIRTLPITIELDNCKKCRKCLKECPVGAITELLTINNECIHCYHCVLCCPSNAIKSPLHKLDNMIKFNKKIIGIENPPNKIVF